MKEIKLDTTIADLLNNYEGMKEILISINPKFKKLNNPILRRTLAKVATIKQAAIIGGMEPIDLLNKLREAVGQEPIEQKVSTKEQDKKEVEPEWFNRDKVEISLDANELLDNEKNPLSEVSKALKRVSKDSIVAIKSDFKPEPLIDEFIKEGKKVYCQKINDDEFITYFKN